MMPLPPLWVPEPVEGEPAEEPEPPFSTVPEPVEGLLPAEGSVSSVPEPVEGVEELSSDWTISQADSGVRSV